MNFLKTDRWTIKLNQWFRKIHVWLGKNPLMNSRSIYFIWELTMYNLHVGNLYIFSWSILVMMFVYIQWLGPLCLSLWCHSLHYYLLTVYGLLQLAEYKDITYCEPIYKNSYTISVHRSLHVALTYSICVCVVIFAAAQLMTDGKLLW